MTAGPRPSPQAPDTAPNTDSPSGTHPAGVDDIGPGFEGSLTMQTPDDGAPSSIRPEPGLDEYPTETEEELAKDLEEDKE